MIPKKRPPIQLLVPLPKSKEGGPDDMDEDEEEAAAVVARDSNDDKDTGDQPVAR